MTLIPQNVLDRLYQIREREDITIKPNAYLRKTIVGPDGTERPVVLRYYQIQMICHLLSVPRFVVGDDTGLGKCQPFSSLVLTNRGLIPIGEIADWSGLQPNTFCDLDQPTGVLVDHEILPIRRFYYGGTKPVITATTRYGYQNSGSHVHPMLVLRSGQHQWVQSRDLKVGDYLCIERRQMLFPETEPALIHGPGPSHMTPSFARFLGYYIGEGSLTAQYRVHVSQCPIKNPEVHADIVRLMLEVFGAQPNHPDDKELCIHNVNLRRWLANNGLDYCKSAIRTVPECILRSTRESTQEFLRALFEGEGHVSTSHIEYSTASQELGRQVQILLLRFGVVSNMSPKKVAAYPDNTYWRLTICGAAAQQFQNEIGFISSRKRKALETCLARARNTNHDVVPDVQDIFEGVRADLLAGTSRTGANSNRTGSGLKQFGVSLVTTLNHIRHNRRNPSYTFIEKVVGLLSEHSPQSESLARLRAIVATNYFYDPIVSLTHTEEEVFDIEVDDPRHCFVANGCLNHNTVETIGTLTYLWDKDPNLKALVLTRKSAVRQWSEEFRKFTEGVTVITCTGSPKTRLAAIEAAQNTEGPVALVMGHRSAVQDFTHLQDLQWGVLAIDEAVVIKNPASQIHQVCKHLANQSQRVWGMTATLIKNNLVEGYGIFKVIYPPLFTHSPSGFIQDYCVTQMQPIGRGRKVPVIVGYKKSDIERFRLKIDPYYLGRPKHAVAKELPVLTSRRIKVGMSATQHLKYQEALSGLLEVDSEEKEVTKLTAVIYCQEIVNHPMLIGCEGESEKLNELVDIVSEGDLSGEKVIVFTRFEKMVTLGVAALTKAGVKSVRITGKENEVERKANQDLFQDPNSDTRVIWITTAGSDAINLQTAKAIIFYDTPFSAGDYIQILGRMIRIGSVHDRVYALHLVCESTIDERVMDIMDRKMTLLESVLGQRIKGEDAADENDVMEAEKGNLDALYSALRNDAMGVLRV